MKFILESDDLQLKNNNSDQYDIIPTPYSPENSALTINEKFAIFDW